MIRRQLFRGSDCRVREVFFIVHEVEVHGTIRAYSLTKERAARRLLGIARNDKFTRSKDNGCPLLPQMMETLAFAQTEHMAIGSLAWRSLSLPG